MNPRRLPLVRPGTGQGPPTTPAFDTRGRCLAVSDFGGGGALADWSTAFLDELCGLGVRIPAVVALDGPDVLACGALATQLRAVADPVYVCDPSRPLGTEVGAWLARMPAVDLWLLVGRRQVLAARAWRRLVLFGPPGERPAQARAALSPRQAWLAGERSGTARALARAVAGHR